MKELFLAFVPRFINDQIALTDNGEQYEIALQHGGCESGRTV